MNNIANAVEVRGVSKSFRLYHERNQSLKAALMRGGISKYEDFWALREVSLEIPRGSTYALIGDNGSGKSTLLKCIAHILVPNSGSVEVSGRTAAMLEVGSGFHPELSGRENIYLNASILGMPKKMIDRKFDEIVEFSGVGSFIDQPVKNYSSGMYVRLGFSIAIHTEPDVLLVDEILAVGDAAFQEKCALKFGDLRERGKTVVVVSHSISQLRAMADHAAWLEKGKLVDVGRARVILERYADANREGVHVDGEGRVRWGTGDARIDRVELLGLDGRSLPTEIPAFTPIICRLHFSTRNVISRPNFGLSLDAPDGSLVWATYSADNNVYVDEISSSGWIEYVIPNLTLQPGHYPLQASIIDPVGPTVVDAVREIATISVSTSTSHEAGGWLTFGGTWRYRA